MNAFVFAVMRAFQGKLKKPPDKQPRKTDTDADPPPPAPRDSAQENLPKADD